MRVKEPVLVVKRRDLPLWFWHGWLQIAPQDFVKMCPQIKHFINTFWIFVKWSLPTGMSSGWRQVENTLWNITSWTHCKLFLGAPLLVCNPALDNVSLFNQKIKMHFLYSLQYYCLKIYPHSKIEWFSLQKVFSNWTVFCRCRQNPQHICCYKKKYSLSAIVWCQ